ncbi:hypothetical protein F443_17268 [Phytophthora nicotianae P1569]|uniref:Uncharacterized protein n=1 Tax=Phytophthora nicotianae P1569 TaxID=1317065 RepID=V9EBY8_PHYNI|nr:hypothetical protein F443_17268 [Phytophthora nicotianae P1569]
MPGNGKSAKRTTDARSGRPKRVKVMPASGAPPMDLALLVVTFVGFLTVEEVMTAMLLRYYAWAKLVKVVAVLELMLMKAIFQV